LQPWQPPTARSDPLRRQPFPLPRIVERPDLSDAEPGQVTPRNLQLSRLVPPPRSVGRAGAVIGARRLIRPTALPQSDPARHLQYPTLRHRALCRR
jgi:hypothetical protein